MDYPDVRSCKYFPLKKLRKTSLGASEGTSRLDRRNALTIVNTGGQIAIPEINIPKAALRFPFFGSGKRGMSRTGSIGEGRVFATSGSVFLTEKVEIMIASYQRRVRISQLEKGTPQVAASLQAKRMWASWSPRPIRSLS